jgi:hypothetical protein
MNKLKRFLLSRSFVITLIVLILGAILLAYVFPQRFTTSQYELEQWKYTNPFWSQWLDRLGLDHVYTTPWFAILLMVFLISIMFSTYGQIKLAIKKTFGKAAVAGEWNMGTSSPEDEVVKAIKKAGYIQTGKDSAMLRFIKHPWGYWGNVFLHIGINIVIGASLLITITESRGLLHLVEGETYLPGNPWVVGEAGMLANRFVLPVTVRLDRVATEFWETDDVKNVSTAVTFTDTKGAFTKHDLGINRAVNYSGLRIYQGSRFGDAFFVEITNGEGRLFRSILQIEHPRKKDQAGYGNFFIEGVPYMLKAKYYADAEKKSIQTADPLLLMRFVLREQSIADVSLKNHKKGLLDMKIAEKENVIDEVALKIGEVKRFGPYNVRLVRVTPWSSIIFVRSAGMPGIFTGFLIIIAGVSLTYFTPPREVIAIREEQDMRLSWRASKFESFYEDEFKKISEVLGKSTTS